VKSYRVELDWAAPTEPFRHSWEGLLNVDQFRWLVRRDMQEQLQMARDELRGRHVRAVGIFDEELRVFGPDPKEYDAGPNRRVRLNWQVVDYVVDSLLDIGINPMITTTFTPPHMASTEMVTFSTRARTGPPRDLAAWEELIAAATRHFVNRYGRATVRDWYFESWNEPNLRNFWDGTQEQFHALWQATWRGVKGVDAGIRLGGPSTARAEWIREFIVFGRQHDCAADFVIGHVYNNDSELGALSPFAGPQEDKRSRSPHFASGVMRGARALLDELGYTGELHFNEWGRSWLPFDPVRETAAEAAFVCRTMAEASQSADVYAYWCMSDIYDQVGYGAEAFHGNYGLLNLQGLRKPVWHAFQLLSRLGRRRLPAQLTDGPALAGAIATRDDNVARLLVFAEAAETATAEPVTITCPVPTGQPRVRLHRISSSENNILHHWQQLGAPPNLTREQTRALAKTNGLAESAPPVVRDRTAQFTMESPGVALLEFDSPTGDPWQ
jgi:xylan 1,4-beta-xylosidase